MFRDGRWLCPGCRGRLAGSARPLEQREGGDFPYLEGERFFDSLISCWDFSKDIETLVHSAKYSGMQGLARHLGASAGLAVRSLLVGRGFDGLVPVPLHRVRERERGYNQARRIAEGLSEASGVPVLDGLIARARETRTQTELPAERRRENVSGAFAERPQNRPGAARGLSLLVVDDVVTTGATLNACARALRGAGAAAVSGFALARPKLRAGRP